MANSDHALPSNTAIMITPKTMTNRRSIMLGTRPANTVPKEPPMTAATRLAAT